MIGSPFSFPVTVQEKELRTFGYDSATTMDGWTEPSDTLYPWSGYAVYAEEPRVINSSAFSK